MKRTCDVPMVLFIILLLCVLFPACQDDTNSSGSNDQKADQEPDDEDQSVELVIDPKIRLKNFLEQLGVAQYLDVRHTRTEPGKNNYTNYYYSLDDCRCFDGDEAHVSVSEGTSNKVMIFLEGGGARWPGGGFAVDLDMLMDISFKSRKEQNPLGDWHFVYVPYCDASIHSGDSVVEYDGQMRYHWGLRHTSAAVALTKQLFPDPEKILVAGSSAGGFGTFYGWAVTKYLFLETDTYILNDSGVGFWDPGQPETWQTIKSAWNLNIPEECVRCDGPILTYVYDLYFKYDDQVRIGMFTSYNDWIINRMFFQMDPADFESTLLTVTDDIHFENPSRFNRFFVTGNSHTSYEFLFPQGPEYQINGVSMYDWIDMLVNDDPAWPDLLE